MCAMADRLRELIDLVLASLDEPGADGRALAERASFSRDHLDRLLSAATGETPVGLRRRLLLERSAWQLRAGGATVSEASAAAGYGSLAAFSRAFTRAYGQPPSAFARSRDAVELPAPNGIHFHPPAGLLLPTRANAATAGATRATDAGVPGAASEPDATGPGAAMARATGAGAAGIRPGGRDLVDRLVTHHLDRVGELLQAAATIAPEQLLRPLRPGFVAVWFEGEEASAGLMAQRLVRTLEVWVAAIGGTAQPEPPLDDDAAPLPAHELHARFRPAARAFARQVRAIRDRGAWDDAFVDALCEPPQSFTYGGVVAHVVEFGAIRREALATLLAELGADGIGNPDAILWEQG
jgi:AraC-like DNA-binding protein